MPCQYSADLKARVAVMFFDQRSDVYTICKHLGLKKTLVYNFINQHLTRTKLLDQLEAGKIPTNRCAIKHANRCGRPRILNNIDEQYITTLVELRPTIYLNEIQETLLQACGVSISIPTLCRALQRLNFSRKIVSAQAFERNEMQWSHYMLQIARIAPQPDMLIFVDEAAWNRRTSQRKYGRANKGTRYPIYNTISRAT
ncbi:hypothetical protein EV368DRAFT_76973 [Lentinula lateritia]|nr:hypothetical protein EV368DRAFT_76973 [Lentinula lateritia]